jgi:hypothetical protein
MPMTHSSTPRAAARTGSQVVEQRDQRIAAFERETLLADVLGVQVALEAFGCSQLPQNVLTAPRR